MNAPFGKNLESACKAYAYQQSMKFVDVECAYCGYLMKGWFRQKDAHKPHYCSQACQIAAVEDARE